MLCHAVVVVLSVRAGQTGKDAVVHGMGFSGATSNGTNRGSVTYASSECGGDEFKLEGETLNVCGNEVTKNNVGSTGFSRIVFAEGVESVKENAFDHMSIHSVSFPSTMVWIGASAFGDNYELESVTLPDSVTTIGSRAFQICRKMASLTLGSGVTNIGPDSFKQCRSLTSVTIPAGVTAIGGKAFGTCSLLESVVMLCTSVEIGSAAFQLCDQLKSFVYCGTEVIYTADMFKDSGSLLFVTVVPGYKGSTFGGKEARVDGCQEACGLAPCTKAFTPGEHHLFGGVYVIIKVGLFTDVLFSS